MTDAWVELIGRDRGARRIGSGGMRGVREEEGVGGEGGRGLWAANQ
jgi:hypothetical protein